MRCKSAHKSAWQTRGWGVIYAADDGLVGLKGSIRLTKVARILLCKLPQLVPHEIPNVELPMMRHT